MMNFRFPHITSGYLGKEHDQLSLNSSFYSIILRDLSLLNSPVIFPQRVPKTEFFEELLLLESKDISEQLRIKQNELNQLLTNTLVTLDKQSTKQRYFLNILHMMLRFGLSDSILIVEHQYIANHLDQNHLAEFELIQVIAMFILNNHINESNLEILLQKGLSDQCNQRIRILILNYLIVANYRFNLKLPNHKYLQQCHETLMHLIQFSKSTDFAAMIRISVAYRGLAMMTELNDIVKSKYLKKAEYFARNTQPNGSLETLIAKENLFTCLQTLAKWYITYNQLHHAESCLSEMITLDPHDSSGYGEMAFFLLNQDRVQEAESSFKRAAELGPPAVGMHTYYYGKSLHLLDKNNGSMNI